MEGQFLHNITATSVIITLLAYITISYNYGKDISVSSVMIGVDDVSLDQYFHGYLEDLGSLGTLHPNKDMKFR